MKIKLDPQQHYLIHFVFAGAVSHVHPTVNLITEPVSQIVPPIVNSLYQGTNDEEDLHYYHSSDTDETHTSAPTLNSAHQTTAEGSNQTRMV